MLGKKKESLIEAEAFDPAFRCYRLSSLLTGRGTWHFDITGVKKKNKKRRKEKIRTKTKCDENGIGLDKVDAVTVSEACAPFGNETAKTTNLLTTSFPDMITYFRVYIFTFLIGHCRPKECAIVDVPFSRFVPFAQDFRN